MRWIVFLSVCLLFCSGCQYYQPKEPEVKTNPVVILSTSQGDIRVELLQNKAPETVKSFLAYVDEKFYDQTIFHRVIPKFMIQGGGFTADMQQKKTHAPIRNEAQNREPNARGTLAMARTSDVHSATAQFFINLVDNDFLNFQQPTASGYGYCVFGRVTSGMEIVDKIGLSATSTQKGHQDVPVEPIKILSITRANS